MRFFYQFIIATLLLSSTCLSAREFANCNHHCKRSDNSLCPGVRLLLTPDLCNDWYAISFLGEAGVRNYRANGTIGFEFGQCQRIKVGGEYLTQKLGYHFSNGRSHHWVHQYAVGGGYQYLFGGCGFIQSFDLGGYYSHAYDKRLRTKRCFTGSPFVDRLVFRRIAGSNAYNVSGGFTITPWYCAELYLAADYDHVKYTRRFRHDKLVAGWGGSVGFYQCLPCNFTFGARGEFKRPYNYIEALIGWSPQTSWGNINLGLYGGHTYGKDRLPSSSVAGLVIGWDFGGFFNSNCCQTDCCTPCTPCNDLARWISISPAVYVPTVLAIAEQRHIVFDSTPVPPPSECINPLVLGSLGPLQFNDQDLPVDISTSQLFNTLGQTPTFTLVVDTPDTVVATIDPVTGVIMLDDFPGDMIHTLFVTATVPGGCSATTTVQIQLTEEQPVSMPLNR